VDAVNAQLKLIRQLAESRGCTLYAILFRNAGVGFQWYEEARCKAGVGKDFNTGLVVYHYYPTIEDAYAAEIERLKTLPAMVPS
jgi:hypothetical protein